MAFSIKGSVEAKVQRVIKKSNSIKVGIDEKKVIMGIKDSKYFSWKEKCIFCIAKVCFRLTALANYPLIHLINDSEWFYFAETFLSLSDQILMYFWTFWSQGDNLWNAEMSQTVAIFAQTSDQLIFSASKVARATTTDLSWLSMYSYIKDRTRQGPLKGCWLGAQRDENTNCRVCQWVSSSIPSLYAVVLQILS